MYVVAVIPLAKIPHPAPQTLDYFTAEEVSPGGIVRISLGSRNILGVVGACTPLTQRKQHIKKSAFQLKKIEAVVNKNPLIPKPYLKLALWSADYFYSPLGHIMRVYLPQIFSRPTKKLLADLAGLESQKPIPAHRASPSKRPVLYWARHNMKAKIAFYQKAIRRTFANKQSVLFLVPELYKIEQFRKQIPELAPMEVVHSNLTSSKQYGVWKRALNGEVHGVIGTRSAQATPLSDLGLIIIDEEESPLYKSFDQQPYMHTKTVALNLGRLTGAEVILGSNLPSIESLWQAKKASYSLQIAPGAKHTKRDIQLVDMREEIKSGNFSIFSRELQAQLKDVIEKKQQAIFFINRRGLSSGLVCRDCGHILNCPNCDVPMVYHEAGHTTKGARYKLLCHHCGQRQTPPTLCPQCKSYRIKFVGAGTQRVEQEVKKFCAESKLPKGACRVARLDTDIAPKWDQQKRIFDDFRGEKYNILIGTQLMLKEGLLPGASLSAIVTIDPLLSLPDFRIGEQVLRIVDKLWTSSMSPVLFQTYVIDNPLFDAVLNSTLKTDYKSSDVYNNFLHNINIQEYEELSFPPFSQLVKLTYTQKSSQKAEQEAKTLVNKLHTQWRSISVNRRQDPGIVQILGPSPAFIPRQKGGYIWQIVLKSKIADLRIRNMLLRVVPSNWKIDVDPVEML